MDTELRSKDAFDVIIVGGGSTGCALAARLSEHASRSVLLIEAGKDYGSIDSFPIAMQNSHSNAASLPGNPDSWPMMATLRDDVKYPITRGRVLGGSSAVNGSLFMRGLPADYAAWEAAGNKGWGYADVLPYFIRLETDLDFGATDVHGANGPMPVKRADAQALSPVSAAFVQACRDLGFRWDSDINGTDPGGVGLVPTNAIGGIRQNVAVRYLDPVRLRPNLVIRDQHLVHEIIVENARAVAVRGKSDSGAFTYSADEIFLCAGAIHSPQLLMLSGIGPSKELRDLDIPVQLDLPAVGKNLMDHPNLNIPYSVMTSAREKGHAPLSEVRLEYSSDDPVHSRDLNMRMMPTLYSKSQLLFSLGAGKSIREKLGAAAFLRRPLKTFQGVRGMSVAALRQDVAHRSDLTMSCGNELPSSRGELRIVSRDPNISPAINFNYLSEPQDLDRFIGVAELTAEILSRPSYREIGARIHIPKDTLASRQSLKEWVLAHLGTSYHSACTCRMGSEQDGSNVVDGEFRVYGIDNLRVIDISVLPLLIRRGTNATAVMLAERAADMIGS